MLSSSSNISTLHPIPQTIAPRIALSFDRNHKDLQEKALTAKLGSLNPNEKIVFFCESRLIEQKSLHQYSIELLHSDSSESTASAATLLLSHILTGTPGGANYFATVIATIYADAYFKKLFMEEHYKKYTAQKYLGDGKTALPNDPFPTLGYGAQMTVMNMKGLFTLLDREIPRQPIDEQESFFQGHIRDCATAMENEEAFNTGILGPISEALAVIKIRQIEKKLGDTFDPTIEVSSAYVRELFYSSENVEEKWVFDLNNRRTKFQVQKIERVIKRFMKEDPLAKEFIFLPRVGLSHRGDMIEGLQKIFGAENIREISLVEAPLDGIEKVIKESFTDP